jgi:GAF domain-containing protein
MPTTDYFQRYLNALAEIHRNLDLEATQNAVVRQATLVFDARGAGIMLYNPDEENLLLSASFGLSDAYREKGTVSPRRSLGETIHKSPVIVQDVATDPRVQYPDAAAQEGVRSIIGLPLSAGSALVGSLRLYFARPREFSADEMEALKAFAVQAGLALKKAYYFASIREAVSEIQGMPSLDFKETLAALLKTVSRYALSRGSALLMLDRKTNTLASVVRYGISDKYLAKGTVFAGLSLGETTTGRPVVVSDVATDPRVQYKEAAAAEGIKTILGVPVRIAGEIAGALRLYYPFQFEPGPDYLLWMEHLAHQMGIALEKTQLLVKLKERANWYEDVLRDLER